MNIGDFVIKKSKKPFKSGLKIERVLGFDVNQIDPNKRRCVVFKGGDICNESMLNVYTPSLFELSTLKEDVSYKHIPSKFKNSFISYMFGKTFYIKDECNYYYFSDFNRWYNLNIKEIERDCKIDTILNN